MFDDVARTQQCASRPLKHGVLYQRGAGDALFSVYFSRTSSRGSVEIALADENIARMYKRSGASVREWLDYLTSHIGKSANSPTSQGYPRVAIDTVESGHRLANAIQAFLSGQPYRLTEVPAIEQPARLTVDERVLSAIMTRRGQADFREKLLLAYESRCAITGCNVQEALEAAHIIPFSEEQNYALSNGILMRADIHTLFDIFLLSIEPATYRVRVAPSLVPSYGELHGKQVTIPSHQSSRPDVERLAMHFREWQMRWSGEQE